MIEVKTGVVAGVEVSRVDAIFQVLSFVADLTGLQWAKPLLRQGLVENQYIQQFWIQSVDMKGEIGQELVLSIDWDKHEVLMASGQATVLVPANSGATATFAPEFLRVLNLFEHYRLERELWNTYLVTPRVIAGVDVVEALGLGVAKPLVYTGPKLRGEVAVRTLDELSIAYGMYDMPVSVPSEGERALGKVTSVGREYGFLRPDGQAGRPDYWFSLRTWPGGRCSSGDAARFTKGLDELGRRVALAIDPTDGPPAPLARKPGGNRW